MSDLCEEIGAHPPDRLVRSTWGGTVVQPRLVYLGLEARWSAGARLLVAPFYGAMQTLRQETGTNRRRALGNAVTLLWHEGVGRAL